jgi:hypothetical protein
MVSYSKAAMEHAMKVQEVILRAVAKKTTVVTRGFLLRESGSDWGPIAVPESSLQRLKGGCQCPLNVNQLPLNNGTLTRWQLGRVGLPFEDLHSSQNGVIEQE